MAGNVTGLEAVLSAMKKHVKDKSKGMERGLKRAGLFVQRESQKIVPVDTGALKNSARTTATGQGFKTVVNVSYGTAYAVFVHENLEAAHQPGKTAKFLEKVMRERRDEIVDIVETDLV